MVLGSHKGRHFLKGNRVHWLEKKSIQSIQPDELNADGSSYLSSLEHCNGNAESMGSNPVRVPKFFSG